jgi:glycosyltransferase involved in cell wall biosynthesis
MKILQLTCHFSPNVGGVETHLDDLVEALSEENSVFVLAYRPLTTKAKWSVWQDKKNIKIFRIPWLPGLFYKLVKSLILEFLYLLPGIFVATPFVLLLNRPNVVHAHGLVAGFVGVFWGKVFGVRTVVSVHSIYHFPKRGLYSAFVRFIFKNADVVLALSKQSAKEVEKLGIKKGKIRVFTYWIDLKKFKRVAGAKNKLGWDGFNVLYVGRLVEEKGVKVLVNSTKIWSKGINLKIIGTGPLEGKVKNYDLKHKNIEYIGKVENDKLPEYYSAADFLIVPSIHEEGFGRVILEALACGIPVIGSNRGAIPEAMDNSVGKLIDVNSVNIKKTVEYYYRNRAKLNALSKNARKYAMKRYSKDNFETILRVLSS